SRAFLARASFWRFSVTPSSLSSHSLATDYWLLATGYCSRATDHDSPTPRQTSGIRSYADPPPLATACYRPGPDLDERPLFIQYVTEPGDCFGQIKLFLALESWCAKIGGINKIG